MSADLGVDSMPRKVHNTPGEFGEDFVKEAVEEAKRKYGGELTEPVDYEATVTVNPGTVIQICVQFGHVIICVPPDDEVM